LKLMVEVLIKFVPFTVKVNAALPAVALAGEMVVMVGTGFGADTKNTTAVDVPPPGDGLVTVML
jgi:hypothetical protein